MEKEKLSSVIEVLESGARPKGGAVEFQTDTIPSLGAEHLNDFGGFNFNKVKYVPKSFFNDMTKGIIARGDILVVKDGATTGKVSIVDNSFPFENAAINEHVFLLRVSKDKAFNGYVFHFLKSPIGQIEIQKDFRGATVGGISRRFIDLIKLPFPPISDQTRIANILSKAEALISQRKESLRLLDELLKSTFLEMFGDPVRNEKEWEKKKLIDFCSFENGDRSSNYPSGDELVSEGIIFVNSANIVDFRFRPTNPNFITREKFNSLSKGKCKKGDLLFTLRGNGLGKCCVFDGNYQDGFVNAQIIIIRPNSVAINYFLIEQFRNPSMFNEIWKYGSGSAQPQLSGAQLGKLNVLLPPIKLQTQFAHIVEKTETLKSQYHTSIQELENLYGSLSQKVFSGDLVPLREGVGGGELAMAAEPRVKYGK